MDENNKTTNSATKLEKTDTKTELSKNAVIIILTILIFLLLIYIVGSRLIERKSFEISYEINSALNETTEQAVTTENMININTDNKYELMQLPGIGSSKADAILEYRKENGDFHTIEELKKVSGIGESTFEKLKHLIYVE